jgi:hypothetical protein
LWRAYVEDIFSGGFALRPDCIDAVDFDGRRYLFGDDTGEPLPAPPDGAKQGGDGPAPRKRGGLQARPTPASSLKFSAPNPPTEAGFFCCIAPVRAPGNLL